MTAVKPRRASWRLVAELLAIRLEAHAHCGTHPRSAPADDCPSCRDRAAYDRYLDFGGRDVRPAPDPAAAIVTLAQAAASVPPAPRDITAYTGGRTCLYCPHRAVWDMSGFLSCTALDHMGSALAALAASREQHDGDGAAAGGS